MTLQMISRRWRDRLRLRTNAPVLPRQSGAIPFRIVDGQLLFLIITSRRTGRWIFPKGSPIEGLTPWDVAAREAFEEAGIEGEVENRSIGSYRTVKLIGLRRALFDVDMFPMRCDRLLDEWPEKEHRQREWVVLPEAKRLLSEPRLAELAELTSQRVELASVDR
jgi:8-oxo-dGTP pyrophosphatase MutT (NUDIX family)